MRNPICSKCGGLIESTRLGKQSYCRGCHAEYMRNTRPKHFELSDEARKKANARSYLHVYVKRGKVCKQPCVVCGSERAEAHHTDYNFPLDVTWLCRDHHMEHHATNKANGINLLPSQVGPA